MVVHPQIAKLVVSKDKVYMIFELPDNEIWKYPQNTQGLLIWLLNTRLWRNWFKPITPLVAESLMYRNYPMSVSFAPSWLRDYKRGEFVVWKWCADQVDRAGSTDWIICLLNREELKPYNKRKKFGRVPLTNHAIAFDCFNFCKEEHREVLRGIFINKDEVDENCDEDTKFNRVLKNMDKAVKREEQNPMDCCHP